MHRSVSATNDGNVREPDGLRWFDLDVAGLREHRNLLVDISERRVDGATVSGVFSAEEVATAVETLASSTADRVPAMFGSMIGQPLAELAASAHPDDRSGYFACAERCRTALKDSFGFHPHERLIEVLTPAGGGRSVRAPSDGTNAYAFGNVRWMEPQGKGLPAHVGNEFQMHNDVSLEQLRSTTRTSDHLSWFVILQPPEAGGALRVFDQVFETPEGVPDAWGDQGRDDRRFGAIPFRAIAPPAGSLVIFGGGWRWHQVEPIGGSRARVTYGGFAGPSLDGSALHFWF